MSKEEIKTIYIKPAKPLTGRKIKMYKFLAKYFGVMIASTIMGFYLSELQVEARTK